eukprot:TRINITY_DN15410_c0_g1_i1.p1 TRINITY_DN15410_c0_g1~~TRINITY_DN15410_c0_g1_i1.p1  ORF type:complete len:1627 (+),score=358.10 TRINITY_DN15410_c0_g1_i1:92-4972(+)
MGKARLSVKPLDGSGTRHFQDAQADALPPLEVKRQAAKKETIKTAAGKTSQSKAGRATSTSDSGEDNLRSRVKRGTTRHISKDVGETSALLSPSGSDDPHVNKASLSARRRQSRTGGSGGGLGSWSSGGAPQQRLQSKAAISNFDKFRRRKEREQQGAIVYDIRTARSNVLRSAAMGNSPSPISWNNEDMYLEDFDSVAASPVPPTDPNETQATWSGSTSGSPLPGRGTPLPGSRPDTRQGARSREAQHKFMLAKETLVTEGDDEDSLLSAVLHRERVKQEYWREYNEAGSAKKTLSEFEEWQRILHGGNTEVSTVAPSSADMVEDGRVSKMSVEDTDWRISHLGFTRRTDHEEYVSDYSRRCRERYYIPLGPRGSTPREAKGHEQPVVDPVSVEPGVLNYGGWSLGSDRLDMLCQANGSMAECKRCDLSGNRIEDRSVKLICERLLQTVEALNLSHNVIGPNGARGFVAYLGKQTALPLLELNLEGNRLGNPTGKGGVDAHEKELCNFVDALALRTPGLRALSLARNDLGRVGHDLGQALGTMVSTLKFLRVLDLHWNSFHGSGACYLLHGVQDNFLAAGALSRLDLSWNRLGMASTSKRQHNPSQALAELLEETQTLFHLDISYNSIGVEDCARIANGLRHNDTLFGLHVAGNEAFMDELGFLNPLTDTRQRMAGVLSMKDSNPQGTGAAPSSSTDHVPCSQVMEDVLRRETRTVSFPVEEEGGMKLAFRDGRYAKTPMPPPEPPEKRPPRRTYPRGKNRSAPSGATTAWEDWKDGQSSLLLAGSFKSCHLDGIELRAEHCWICDRHEAVKLVWTPSISGSQLEEEIKCVHAYVSSDDFSRATVLNRVEDKQGVRFMAFRMVPRLKEGTNLLVAFRVNGRLQLASDLPVRYLPTPVSVEKVSEAELASWTAAEGAVAEPPVEEDMGSNETCWTNELMIKDFSRSPIVVTEAAVAEGEIEVYPRDVRKKEAPPIPVWNKSLSVFSSWREYDRALLDRMLMADLHHCRIQKFAGQQNDIELKQAIFPFYDKLVATYRQLSIWGEKHHVFGVSLHSLTALMQKSNVFDRTLPVEHLSSIAFAAHSLDRKFHEDVKVSSDQLLIRFQFLEIVLRIAESKFMRSKQTSNLAEAVGMLFSQHLEARLSEPMTQHVLFKADFLTEEVDLVFKAHLGLLSTAFEIYAGATVPPVEMIYAGESKKNRKIELPDFYRLCDDCDAYDDRFLRRKVATAFELGGTWHIDETASGRHMQLNFVEFLAALAGVVFLRELYRSEEMADLLEEFIVDQLQPVVLENRHMISTPSKLHKAEGTISSKAMKKACKEVFKACDEDESNSLSVREFSRVLKDERTQQLFGGKTFNVKPADIMSVFNMMDEDGNQELSFPEVMAGLLSLVKLEQNAPRVRAFLWKELSGGSGEAQFTAISLANFLSKSTTQRKLMRVGINVMQLKDVVLKIIDAPTGSRSEEKLDSALLLMFTSSALLEREKAFRNFSETISSMGWDKHLHSASEFADHVLRLRKPKPIPRWKIFMKLLFEQADVDQCGTLTREEFQAVLQPAATQAKLRALGMDTDAIDELFSILDVDQSDDISEGELLRGVEVMMQLQEELGGKVPEVWQLKQRLEGCNQDAD